MERWSLEDDRVVSVQALSVSYLLVVADDRLVYEGNNDKEATEALYHAAKEGANTVSCFINGVKVIYSRAVSKGLE